MSGDHSDVATPGSLPPARVGWLWVIVLLLAYTSSFIDRQILSLLVGPIKHDLRINDTQFSLLTGMAFAIFYSLMGLPIGELIDRHPRRLIASLGLMSWSIATAFCGLSGTYAQLFAARIGVSVGESALTPSASSLLSDCFPPRLLGRAISVYMLGGALGAGLALILGGGIVSHIANAAPFTLPLVGTLRSWQTAFLIVGLLGLPVAVLMWLLPEPARLERQSPVDTSRWSDVLMLVRRHRRFYIPLLAGAACYGGITMAILGWAPAYYMRVFGMNPGQIGVRMGIATVLGIGGGLLSGAWLSEWIVARGRIEGQLLTSAAGLALAAVAAVSTFIVGDATVSIMLLSVAMIGANIPGGIALACLQAVSPNRLRGRMTAIFFAFISVVGGTMGPLVPALLVDYVFRDEHRIGAATALLTGIAGVAGAWLMMRAARAYVTLRAQEAEAATG